MAGYIPELPATTGSVRQYRLLFLRPVAQSTNGLRIVLVGQANITGYLPISKHDLPQGFRLDRYRAKEYDRFVETHMRDYCLSPLRSNRRWNFLAEIEASNVVHYYGDSLTPVTAVLLDRPWQQKQDKSGPAMLRRLCEKVQKWRDSRQRSSWKKLDAEDEGRPLLEEEAGW